MAGGLAYIVEEYCTQSHLSTEDYGRAMQGLKQTRRFKKHTLFIRVIPDYIIKTTKSLAYKISGGKIRLERRSLVWSTKIRDNPQLFLPKEGSSSLVLQESKGFGTVRTSREVSEPTDRHEVQVKVNHVTSSSFPPSRVLDVEKGLDQ